MQPATTDDGELQREADETSTTQLAKPLMSLHHQSSADDNCTTVNSISSRPVKRVTYGSGVPTRSFSARYSPSSRRLMVQQQCHPAGVDSTDTQIVIERCSASASAN